MTAKITSYIDAAGRRKTGYIIDGRTYKDEAGTQAVERGSIVSAGGQQYVKGVGAGGESMLLGDYLSSRNMSETGYVAPDGGLKTGYIKDGVTYSDILATTPVAGGSIVSAGGQTWVKGAGEKGESLLYADALKNVGAGSKSSAAEAEAESLRQLEADKSRGEALYAEYMKKSAEDSARQKASAEEETRRLNKALYRDYMYDRKNLPQLLAAQGIRGGLSESSLLALEAAYQGEISENLRSKLSRIGAIEAQQAETGLELLRDKQTAEEKAETAHAERLAGLRKEQEAEAEAEAERLAAGEKLLYARTVEKAEALAKYGDFSGYRALGFTEAEIASMEEAYEREQFSALLKIAREKARYGDSSMLLELVG